MPYLWGSTPRRCPPDFIVRIDDGFEAPLNLIVEFGGYRGEDAKEKANALHAYWVPGVNNLGKFGRWAAAEFRAIYEIEVEFDRLIETHCATPPSLRGGAADEAIHSAAARGWIASPPARNDGAPV